MIGAIIGDIVGSIYERHNIKTKDFPLFSKYSRFTDDTVMTIAIAEGIMNGAGSDDFIDAMKKYGRMYPHAGYGANFKKWLMSDSREPYNSWGNGAAMRVSPVGWISSSEYYCRTGKYGHEIAALTASVTHNHPEAIKAAQCVAEAISACRHLSELENCKSLVKKIAEKYGYDLSRTLDEIRPTYRFHVSCQNTVPQAITAFLESTDFEDAIRNAVSIGGDSDTIAAITGSIAEAAYGIPQRIIDKAWTYLDEPLKDVCRRWRDFIKQ